LQVREADAPQEIPERVRRRRATQRQGVGPARPLPPPPFPGNADIVPITTWDDLKLEGKAQHNCAGTYALGVSTTKFYIYRVLRPERATLSITKRRNRWVVDQLKAACNRYVSGTTILAVQTWLYKCNANLAKAQMHETA
jgi:hypothetical protein